MSWTLNDDVGWWRWSLPSETFPVRNLTHSSALTQNGTDLKAKENRTLTRSAHFKGAAFSEHCTRPWSQKWPPGGAYFFFTRSCFCLYFDLRATYWRKIAPYQYKVFWRRFRSVFRTLLAGLLWFWFFHHNYILQCSAVCAISRLHTKTRLYHFALQYN